MKRSAGCRTASLPGSLSKTQPIEPRARSAQEIHSTLDERRHPRLAHETMLSRQVHRGGRGAVMWIGAGGAGAVSLTHDHSNDFYHFPTPRSRIAAHKVVTEYSFPRSRHKLPDSSRVDGSVLNRRITVGSVALRHFTITPPALRVLATTLNDTDGGQNAQSPAPSRDGAAPVLSLGLRFARS